MSLDFFIGINGCSLKTEDNLSVVTRIPLERLMIETGIQWDKMILFEIFFHDTDSPWCEIKPSHASYKFVETKPESRKKEKFVEGLQVKGRNEPVNLVQVLEVIAALKKLPKEEVAEKLNQNTLSLFNL